MTEARSEGAGALTFEEALARLEEVVRALEAGDRSLEESLALFQEGIALARLCQARLDEAEARIEKLLEIRDGAAVTEPFEPPGGQNP